MPLPVPPPALLAEAPVPGVAALAAAELAFAHLADQRGIKAAFLAYLADDAVLFRPLPTSGLRWFQERPDPPAHLSWWPSVAELSASGDLGWTTGPWELRKAKGDAEPVAYGHFVSVWKRQADGQWKVLIDDGIDHARPDAALPLASRLLEGPAAPAIPQALRALDATLSAESPRVAKDVRVYRPGQVPTEGRAAFAQALAGPGQVSAWAPLSSGLSTAGDLGYTYGVAALNQAKASYLHIWRRNGAGWELALEILRPIPAAH